MIPRRSLLAAGPLALAACRSAKGACFGRVDPPKAQRLVVVLGVGPGSLGPATSADRAEEAVLFALFEGLTTLPLTDCVWPCLAKPFVKELGRNLLDRQQLKYVWIDTKWRP